MSLNADRLIALLMLAFSVGYGYLAWTHPLLPFEARQPFKPNTLPMGLAVLAAVLSLATLVYESSDDLPEDATGWRSFEWRTAAVLVVLMVAYALLLRPAGYILATTGFLVAGGYLLGERKYAVLATVAIITSVLTWFIVQRGLGIYLVPLPAFLGGA